MNELPEDIASAFDVLARWRPELALDVRWLTSVPSTMDAAASLEIPEDSAGVIVGADEQSAGRGRRGHAWHSPPGAGLYFSWRSRPPLDASALPLVTLAAGVGVHQGLLRSTGLKTDLKWPNDVLIDGKKVAGILAEGCAVGSPEQSVVVGVGLNLRQSVYPPDVAARATSLETVLGWPPERAEVLVEVVCGLVDSVAEVARDRDGILQAWRAAARSATGTAVEWSTLSGDVRGITAGIDDTGALLVQVADRIERVIAGEVRWLTSGN